MIPDYIDPANIVTVCMTCGKINRGGEWIVGKSSHGELFSHGYCDACGKAAMKALEERLADAQG